MRTCEASYGPLRALCWTHGLKRPSAATIRPSVPPLRTSVTRGPRSWLGSTLASRTTLVANHLHCTAVSVLAVYLLARHPRGTLEDYRSWQVLGLPLSLAYFLGDIYWYCIPQRDYLIAFHHATMLACHYPVGSDAGAALCGAGDALFAVRLSLLGYLCELSNPLMNWRWWLMQTLQAHRWDFAVVNVLLMLSFVLRAVLLGWLLCGVLLPRAADFVEAKQVFIYGTCVLGHGVILALSLFWLRVLLKNGLRGLLVFRVDPAKVAGFSTFGSDMGRAAPKSKQKRR